MATEGPGVTELPDWRARRWAATHQRIYDAALALFLEHGFDGVNVGQIARAAGVSVPTFYAHYPSKEHIIMQLPTAEEVAAIIAELPADLPFTERLRRGPGQFLAAWAPPVPAPPLVRWRGHAGPPGRRGPGGAV